MVKKLNFVVGLFAAALLMCTSQADAQTALNPTDDNFVIKPHKARHAEWREGKSQFPGRPRDMCSKT